MIDYMNDVSNDLAVWIGRRLVGVARRTLGDFELGLPILHNWRLHPDLRLLLPSSTRSNLSASVRIPHLSYYLLSIALVFGVYGDASQALSGGSIEGGRTISNCSPKNSDQSSSFPQLQRAQLHTLSSLYNINQLL